MRRVLPFVAGGALTVLVAGFVISSIVTRRDADQLRDRLTRDAAILEQTLRRVPPTGDMTENWMGLATEWQATLGARVQLFDSTGNLRIDSEGPPGGSDSQESENADGIVRRALQEEQGWQIRGDILYVVQMLRENDPAAGVILLSAPLGQLDSQHKKIRWLLICVMGGAVVVVAAIFVLSLISATRALTRLAQDTARFSEGDWDVRVPIDPYRRADEFAAVAHAFNRMAGEVKLRFDQQRRESEQLEAVLSNMNDGLLAVDSAGVVRLVNQTFLRYFRSAFEDPRGHTHTEAFRDRGLNEMIEKTLGEASGEEGELEVSAPSRRVLVVRMALIPDARKHEVRAVLVARDVTARRRLQEMRRDFVANVSHELRTPLTSVLGYIEVLRDTGPHSPEASGFLDTISRNAERMNRIVGDILELSRIEAPGFSLELTAFSLGDLAAEVKESFGGLLNQKSQSLTVAIPDSLEPVVADRDAVGRILTNLVDNAHKYTPAGGHIMIEAQPKNGEIILSVSDDGIGVPQADRPRLFERFFRVDRARSRDSGGTGLGLAIVKHLAEAHGGSAHYEARIPSGSRLVIHLPRPESSAPRTDGTAG